MSVARHVILALATRCGPPSIRGLEEQIRKLRNERFRRRQLEPVAFVLVGGGPSRVHLIGDIKHNAIVSDCPNIVTRCALNAVQVCWSATGYFYFASDRPLLLGFDNHLIREARSLHR